MGLRITCNDILLSLLLVMFIIYDLTNLFTCGEECLILMMKWLLVCHIIVLIMKIMLTIIDNLDEETNCSLHSMKIIAFLFYIILYPFLIFWNILGTMWFFGIEEKVGTQCKTSVDDKSWVVILWITINYFLAVVYLITSIAIIIEWSSAEDRNDMMINLNIDSERGLYLEDDQRNIDHMFLNSKEIKKLRNHVLNTKDLLKLALIGQNCSICFDSMENIKKKVIKLPKCNHLFHWNCLREWVTRSPSCPNCRIYVKQALMEHSNM